MKANRKYVAAAVIAAVLAVPILIKATRGESSKDVDVAVAAAQDIRPTILASGVLAYLEEVNLTSELVAKVRSAIGDGALLICSGMTEANAPALLKFAGGAIVGSFFKHLGRIHEPVDGERVARLRSLLDG